MKKRPTKQRRLLRLALAIMALLTACGQPATPTRTRPAVIPETTKVTDEETRTALTDYDPASGTMRFATNTGFLADLRPDDVLVSVPSTAAPNGYLRKVKTIRQEAGEVVLETTQANLTDAISQGDLDVHYDLEPADLQSATALVEGLQVGLAPQDAVDLGDGYSFRAQFNETVLDIDDGDVTVQVKVSGDLYFNAGYNIGIGIDNINPLAGRLTPEVDRFEFWIGFEQAARLHVWGEANAKLSKEKKVAEYRFTPQCFLILVVPICFVPTVYVFVGASGEVHLNFDYSVEQTAAAKIGAKWVDDKGWSTFDPAPAFDTSFDQNFAVAAGLGLEAHTKAEASLMIYGVAGPTLGAQMGVKLDAAVPRDPFWILTGSLEGYYGFIVDIPVVGRVADSSGTIFQRSKEFGRSSNSPPTIVVKSPTNRVDLGKEVNLGFLTNGGSCDDFYGIYCVIDPETGKTPFTLTSDLDGALPAAMYTFQTPGLRTITIRATDNHGATSTATFKLDVVNTPPTVFGSAGSGTVPQTVPYFVSAAASDPNSKLDCSALTWSVVAPDTVAPLNVAADVCYGRAVFNVMGTRTITLTAHDPQGAVSPARTFSVIVTNPPPDLPPVIDAPLTVTGYHYTDDEGHYEYGAIPYGAEVTPTSNPLQLSVHAYDPEHPSDPDAITYTFSARCSNCSINGDVGLGTNHTGTLELASPMVWYPGTLPSINFMMEVYYSVGVTDGTTATVFNWFVKVYHNGIR